MGKPFLRENSVSIGHCSGGLSFFRHKTTDLVAMATCLVAIFPCLKYNRRLNRTILLEGVSFMAVRIGINGFGRIGRVVMRAALRQKDIEIVHINDLTDTKTLAHLLKYDSVHGSLDSEITAKEGAITVDGKDISISAIRDPKELPWADKNVDLVLECTGIFTKRDDAERHIAAGAPKVLISAPAKGEDITVVYGVNHEDLKPDHKIVSNGSCTTNCLAQ